MDAVRENCYGQPLAEELPRDLTRLASRVMYVENKTGSLNGAGRIGRVYFSRTRRTLYYRDLVLKSMGGRGFKANYRDIETGEEYWVSGPKKNQSDRLYGGNRGVVVDEDVREEYRALIADGKRRGSNV